jgi:hypothetical protein
METIKFRQMKKKTNKKQFQNKHKIIENGKIVALIHIHDRSLS